jgi:hypothetical protein
MRADEVEAFSSQIDLRLRRLGRPLRCCPTPELADDTLISQLRCLVPAFDGAIFSLGWKEALWDKFFMAAPRRQRRSVEQYKIVKRA